MLPVGVLQIDSVSESCGGVAACGRTRGESGKLPSPNRVGVVMWSEPLGGAHLFAAPARVRTCVRGGGGQRWKGLLFCGRPQVSLMGAVRGRDEMEGRAGQGRAGQGVPVVGIDAGKTQICLSRLLW